MIARALIFAILMQPLLLWGAPSLRLAADEWPPFTGSDESRALAQDLVALALRQVGRTMTVSIGPWKRALTGVQSGRFDGLVAVWKSPERETLLLFSRPILENRIRAVTLRASNIAVTRPAELAGWRVGRTTGYAYGAELDSTAAQRIVNAATDREGLARLLSGDIDVLLIDDLSLRYLRSELSEADDARLQLQAQLATQSLYFGMLRSVPGAADIVRAFDRAIKSMMQDGTYNNILGMPWILVDSDGDSRHEIVVGDQAATLESPPLAEDAYQVLEDTPATDLHSGRVYLVGGRQYESWEEARQAIIDKAQTERADPLIQENRYEIGVPF